jgi:GT2 family glycosyltransferase
MTPEVSVVIVNWNGKKILPRCLDALKRQTYLDFEIILVDNGSTDGSLDDLHDDGKYPQRPIMRLVLLGQNLGFAAANNRGAVEARGKWLALLNNDAFPAPNWLESLVETANKFSNFQVFASKLVSDVDETTVDSAGDILHTSGMAWHRGRGRPAEEFSGRPVEVFSPCAAAAMYDRQAFMEVGGFQERFFSHHEDVDLGFRLRLNGARCLFIPQAVVRHVGSASFGIESYQTIKNGHRNMVWSYIENMPGSLFWRYLPAHLLANLFFLVFYTLRGQGKAIWTAKWQAVLGLSYSFNRRRLIQKNRKVPTGYISSILDHGWLSPYLLGRRTARWKR